MAYAPPMNIRAIVREAKALVDKDPLPAFLTKFYKKHVGLSRFKPKVFNKSDSGPGKGHPWASQRGDDIHLFPKFWELDAKTRDFAFAHELGHWVSTQLGLSKLIEIANSLGIDPWNTNALPYGQFNMEEAFAETFADVHLNQSEARKRYPQWCKLVDFAIDAL